MTTIKFLKLNGSPRNGGPYQEISIRLDSESVHQVMTFANDFCRDNRGFTVESVDYQPVPKFVRPASFDYIPRGWDKV